MVHAWYAPWYAFGGMPFESIGAFIMLILVVWSALWKGLALWHAARDGKRGWFIALFLINTLGILEILYIYVFREGVHTLRNAHHTKSSSE